MTLSVIVMAYLAIVLPPGGQGAPSLDDVVARMSRYVAAYGAQASVFVGIEDYTQRVEDKDGRLYTPRHLVSEFAIVKAGGGDNWIGYRDVVQVNDKPVADRRDRLLALLTSTSVDTGTLKAIADESARYNIGPIARNFNVPTTALFFFHPATIVRFSFERKGTETINGVVTSELEFRETARPTLVRTREGRDVPARGRIWVVPGDGTVLRTRVELRNFADRPPTWSTTRMNPRIESSAVVEVTYHLDQRAAAWLPVKMSEAYEGPMTAFGGAEPFQGRASGVAEYSAFKRFDTSGRLVLPK